MKETRILLNIVFWTMVVAALTAVVVFETGLLPMGYYALQCKALTQHYCLSDQHAFISVGDQLQNSPALTFDRLDLPAATAQNVWQTLATAPVYVGPGDTLTIGFMGSKQGAIDNAWRSYANGTSTGDKREGWWCATDFRLGHLPVYIRQTEPGAWGTICLPFNILSSADFTLYSIAGITADGSRICLQEVTTPIAGVPYVYHSNVSKLCFFGGDESVERPKNPSGVSSIFVSSGVGKVPIRAYYLKDGQWWSAQTYGQPLLESFTMYISRVNGLSVLDSWDGVSLPIAGVVNAIDQVTATGTTETAPAYTLGGVKARAHQQGVIIRGGKKLVK